jgi:hypothetical protein
MKSQAFATLHGYSACGFRFGVRDDDDGIGDEEWRVDWIKRVMTWCSKGIPCP